MNIRKASKLDVDEIIEISVTTVDKSYRDWLGDETVNRYLETDKLRLYLISNLSDMWLAENNSKVVGFAICIENMIDYILVDSAYQSQGIGSCLLTFCEELLFKKYSTVSLESFEQNISSNHFFNSKGWEYVNKYLDAKSQATKLIYKKNIHTSSYSDLALGV